jgi:hypothetical protein
MLKNYNLEQPDATWNRFSGADDRYIYPAKADILILQKMHTFYQTNTKGFSAIGNITVNAEPIENLKLMAAYSILNLKRFLVCLVVMHICIYRISYS